LSEGEFVLVVTLIQSAAHPRLYKDVGKALTAVQAYFPENGGKVVFPEMSRLDWKRRANLVGLTADPFHLTLSFPGPRVPCSLAEGGKLATYSVSGLSEVLKNYNDTEDVVVRFHLDQDGLVRILNVDVSRVYNETEMVSRVVPDLEAGA
jgi:hypothetical protein